MRFYLILLIILTFNLGYSQVNVDNPLQLKDDIYLSVGYPIKLIGHAEYTYTSLEYDNLNMVMVFNKDDYLRYVSRMSGRKLYMNLIGLGYNPLIVNYKNINLLIGGIIFNHKLPFKHKGAYFNFQININYNITNKIAVGINHISNGLHLLHDYNPGIDNIVLKLKLW